jgi:hypothetical protein
MLKAQTQIYDDSDVPFTILASTITVLSPSGGDHLTVNTSHNIIWESFGTFVNVNIDYSIDSGTNWLPVAANTANDGNYAWTVPATPSTTCQVRVSDAVDGEPSDTNNAAFTITTVEVVSAPSQISGPGSGLPGTAYAFAVSGSVSSSGHAVQYKLDWGDGSDSGWLAVGTTSASHSWASTGTFAVRAMARCAEHNAVESLWSEPHALVITSTGTLYYNSPASRLILPEVSWSTWISDVQITDISGGSSVQAYYHTGTNRRGPFTIWANNGGANCSKCFANILQIIDDLDAGSFTYYGTTGSLELVTQSAIHLIQAAGRTYQGNASRTFPALADEETNTGAIGRTLLIPNISNDALYRPAIVLFNPSEESISLEVKVMGSDGAQIGSLITRTLAGHEANGISTELRANSYSNATVLITATSGNGRVLAAGFTAHNISNDPAAHLAVQASDGYANSPARCLILPEVSWSTWMSDVQITDISGGSTVQIYYNTGTNRRGPFNLWSSSNGANCSKSFINILQILDDLDAGEFTYYGTTGALELVTQDSSHLIQAAGRTYQGNYSRTFPALSEHNANTTSPGRPMLVTDISNDATFRPSVVLVNITPDSATVELKVIGNDGAQIGPIINRTLAGHETSGISTELRANTFSNATIFITVTSGNGRVLAAGFTAHNVSNDPAAHVAVQGQ